MMLTNTQIPLWIQKIIGNPSRFTQAGNIFVITEMMLNFRQSMIETATLLIFIGMISPKSAVGTDPTPRP